MIGGTIGLIAMVGASCGDDEDADPAPAATEPATTAPATTEPATTEPAATTTHDMSTDMPTITVNAVDYAFEDLPATIPAGSELALTNTSTTEVHEIVVLGPIPAEETRTVEELLAAPESETASIEPVLVAVAPPGEDGMVVLGDGTITEPGRYAVICAIPIGADPAEFMAAMQEASDGPPAVDGGAPHFTAGMFAELIVE